MLLDGNREGRDEADQGEVAGDEPRISFGLSPGELLEP
jgi:hypothetical protein